jgi:predicted dienelactone hydrolase
MLALLRYVPDGETAAQPTRGTSAQQVEQSPDGYKLAPGEYGVKSAEFDLPDPARGKALPLKAYAPTSGGPFPVVIFSHGAGGNRNVAPGLARHWASHGYVVLAPSHADSVQLRKEGRAGRQMDDVLKSFGTDPMIRINRVADITLILDSLDALPQLAPSLSGKIDSSRIGLGGHSAGAMTASLVGGATVDMAINGAGGPETRSFRDGRIDALLLLSGQGMTGPGGGFQRHSWDNLTLPTMVQTGSYDNSARTRQTSASRRHPYEYAPPGDKYLVFIDGALHMSFTGRASGEEPGLAARWLEQYLGTPDLATALEYDQRAIFDYIQMSTLAFWDAYLKADPGARAWLASDKLATLSRGQVEYQRK